MCGFTVSNMHLSFGLILLSECSSEEERRVSGRIGRILRSGQRETARVFKYKVNEEQTEGSRTVNSVPCRRGQVTLVSTDYCYVD